MTELKLSDKKYNWAKNRDVVLRGTQLAYNVSPKIRYQKELDDLVKRMTSETKKMVTELFQGNTASEFFEEQKAAAALDESLTALAKRLTAALSDSFIKLFTEKSKPLSSKMISGVSKTSEASLKKSIEKLSGGLSIKTGAVPEGSEDVISALIDENVSLIKSIPKKYFDDISGSIMRSISNGAGLKDLLPEMQKYTSQTKKRVKMISLDQTRKAYNVINKQRMQSLGINKFEWLHSGGGSHPRKSHVAMSGKIYSFDKLPIINKEQVDKGYEGPVRGIPGQAINCGCTMTPVIEFEGDK